MKWKSDLFTSRLKFSRKKRIYNLELGGKKI